MSRPFAGLDTRSVELARHVDQVCSRFEAAWKVGQRPHLEDYLPVDPEGERSALLSGLIPLEAEYRRRLGEEPAAEEYHRRFPAVDPVWLAEAVAAAPTEPAASAPDIAGAAGRDTSAPPLRCPSCGHPRGEGGGSGAEETTCPGCGSPFRL